MADALRRASAASVTAVVPYFGYSRQDRRVAPRSPISAKVVANLLSTAGFSRIVSVDLHAGQLQGFFDIPTEDLSALPAALASILEGERPEDVVVVSPDAGGVERARAASEGTGCDLAIVDKRRPRPNESEVLHLIGDVEGKVAVLVDDLVDTAGTLVKAAEALMARGARRVVGCATHGVLSGPALERIAASCLESLVTTDTIPLPAKAVGMGRLRQVSVAGELADALRRIHAGQAR